VDWNTPETVSGIEVADLPVGTFITQFLAFVVTAWDSDNAVGIAVGVGEDNNDFTVITGLVDAGSAPFGVTGALKNVLSGNGTQDRILCTSDCKLIVQVNLGEASEPTEGSVDIYALISET
jgi:hypothetical protein